MKSKLFFSLIILAAVLPFSVLAADPNPFITLVGIPGVTDTITENGGLNQYINALYRLSISIAALLAVVKIVAAGAKYMLTDIVPAKAEAKKDIQGALIGLLIVIGAIIILNTVNSDLTKVDFNLEGVELKDELPPGPAQDPATAACEGGGGCTYLDCDGIGFSAGNFLTSGAVVGGTLGAFGLVTGPGGAVTTTGGAVVGTLIGGVLYLGQDYASCPLLCSWNNGVMTNNNSVCVIPNNTMAFASEESRIVCEGKGGSQEGNICKFPDEYYEQLATNNCKDDLVCDTAMACDYGRNGGIFAVSCESQCTSGYPDNYYDPVSEGCVRPLIDQPQEKPLQVNALLNYSQVQNEDEIAGDYPVRNIIIMSNVSVNGLVRVRYLDTDEIIDMSCSYITPSVCNL